MNCAGRRRTALADRRPEGRAGRSSRRAAWQASGAAPAGAGRNDEADGRGGRLRQSRLAQQEDRPAGILGAPMQPPRRGQVEACGIAADFEEHRREAAAAARPPRRSTARRSACSLGDQQPGGLDAEEGSQPRRIGKPGLPEDVGGPDPQDGRRGFLEKQADQRQGEAGDAPASRVSAPWISVSAACGRPPPSALSKRSAPVARRPVTARPFRRTSTAPLSGAAAVSSSRSASRPSIFAISWRKAKKVSCATADVAMTVLFPELFLLCSNRFQSTPEEVKRTGQEIYSSRARLPSCTSELKQGRFSSRRRARKTRWRRTGLRTCSRPTSNDGGTMSLERATLCLSR